MRMRHTYRLVKGTAAGVFLAMMMMMSKSKDAKKVNVGKVLSAMTACLHRYLFFPCPHSSPPPRGASTMWVR